MYREFEWLKRAVPGIASSATPRLLRVMTSSSGSRSTTKAQKIHFIRCLVIQAILSELWTFTIVETVFLFYWQSQFIPINMKHGKNPPLKKNSNYGVNRSFSPLESINSNGTLALTFYKWLWRFFFLNYSITHWFLGNICRGPSRSPPRQP